MQLFLTHIQIAFVFSLVIVAVEGLGGDANSVLKSVSI